MTSCISILNYILWQHQWQDTQKRADGTYLAFHIWPHNTAKAASSYESIPNGGLSPGRYLPLSYNLIHYIQKIFNRPFELRSFESSEHVNPGHLNLQNTWNHDIKIFRILESRTFESSEHLIPEYLNPNHSNNNNTEHLNLS